MPKRQWPFADPPNVAVFTVRRVLDGSSWIAYVFHDAEDGAWQFHGHDTTNDIGEAKIVALEEIVNMDPTVVELADLPPSWRAWRVSPNVGWHRAKKDEGS